MLEGLLPHEKVKLLVRDAKERAEVLKFLKPKLDLKNLILYEIPYVDSWIRDYGPTFLKRKNEKAYVKWIFNAWGGKYESLMEDTKIFQPGNKLVPETCFDSGIILEGGSIEVNGAGTCLTTEQCLLNKNRNPQLTRPELEKKLQDYLGVHQILWMHEGIVGDDTDGHIDDIVRFTNSNTILCAYEEDTADENHELLHENWERLWQSRDPQDKKWNLVKLPMPGVVEDGCGRLPASYANFLIANGVVLLPIYSHKNDKQAVKILQELFPKHEILPIECSAMVYGLGAIHCVSQQEPA